MENLCSNSFHMAAALVQMYIMIKATCILYFAYYINLDFVRKMILGCLRCSVTLLIIRGDNFHPFIYNELIWALLISNGSNKIKIKEQRV